ncbi:MAG: ATP-binding protein, partial [Acidobacteriota bacterium]
LPDKARTYFICGGVPFYLKFFSDKQSIPMNIFSQLLQEHAPLYREPDFLLREELREVENYYAVLLAVAGGNSSAQAISKASGIESRSLHYYLQQLVALGYLQRRYPLTGKKPAARHVRFSLEDPLLKFWFRFVYPNTSYLPYMGPELALQHRILPGLDSYFGHCFERLCREALPHLYRREGVTAPFQIGEYWSRDAQIEVVGLRDDGWTDLGECKWGQIRSANKLEQELEKRVGSYPNQRNATIGRRIFIRGNIPPKASKNHLWYGLEDLYRE